MIRAISRATLGFSAMQTIIFSLFFCKGTKISGKFGRIWKIIRNFAQNHKLIINMRTIRLFLAAMLTAVGCSEVAAQGMTQGPKLSGDNKVEFTVRAPEAQKVQVDIGGTKYDMNKGETGIWRVTTKPQVPGFHYYSLIIDGVSVADPASPSFYGCSRWSSAIDIPEKGMDDF